MAEYTPYTDIENIPARNAVEKTGKNRYGLTAQQEKYAQQRALGKDPKACIKAAGLPIKNPALYEHKNPLITARISMLQDTAAVEVVEKMKLDKEWVVAELLRQYQANGTIVQAYDKQGNETNAPQKANEAIKCLELIGKELGMFVERKEVRTGPLESVSDEELTRIAQELYAQLSLSPGSPGTEATEGS